MMKTSFRPAILALLLAASVPTFAQSNAPADYKTQHKAAQKYQKAAQKRDRKQDKANAKRAKAWRKQHQTQRN